MLLVTTSFCLICVNCQKESKESPSSAVNSRVEDMIQSEELILALTPQLRLLSQEITTGKPEKSVALQKNTWGISLLPIEWNDLFKHQNIHYPQYVSTGNWPLASEKENDQLPPWQALTQTSLQWEYAEFGVIKGEFDDPDTFHMHTLFSGKAYDTHKRVLGFQGKQLLEWKKTDGQWKLSGWEQQQLQVTRMKHEAFEEVLDQAIPDKAALSRLRRSLHRELISEGLATGEIKLHQPRYVDLLDVESGFQYPAISTVDYNGDGWDDMFVSSRWGAAQLLENQKDGTFKDVTIQCNLMIKGLVNCALFIDFDNDGDKDLFVGRTQEPSLYFRNDHGKYHDVSASLLDSDDLHMVVSASAADINRDGLMDLYLCTYGPAGNVNQIWVERYLPQQDRNELKARLKQKNRYIDMPGPRNIVLMNRGNGKLERSPLPKQADIWRNTFQAAWADFDQDGDQDVYICNDFAPDTFFRNDTPQGASHPVFTPIGNDIFDTHMMCFGMGASWGDYDNDGDFDIYVSNMYSKAGKRIIKKIGQVDPRIAASAAGNFLYENQDGKFVQVAGPQEGQQRVHKVGWSFGGQFCDFDNDGQLDLYVPSGYYSAPQRIATQVDL